MNGKVNQNDIFLGTFQINNSNIKINKTIFLLYFKLKNSQIFFLLYFKANNFKIKINNKKNPETKL